MSLVTVGFLGFITLAELLPTSRALPRGQKTLEMRLMTAIQRDGDGRQCSKIEAITQSAIAGTEAVTYFIRCSSPSTKNRYRHFLVIRNPDWQYVKAVPIDLE
jgi:hypothetical protein